MTQPVTLFANAIREQNDLIAALEFLDNALRDGPVSVSALNFGWVARAIPLWSIHRAKAQLGIEEYTDPYGIAYWRLPHQSQEGETHGIQHPAKD